MFTFIITAITLWVSVLILGLAADWSEEMLFGGTASFLVGLFLLVWIFSGLGFFGSLFVVAGIPILLGFFLSRA